MPWEEASQAKASRLHAAPPVATLGGLRLCGGPGVLGEDAVVCGLSQERAAEAVGGVIGLILYCWEPGLPVPGGDSPAAVDPG